MGKLNLKKPAIGTTTGRINSDEPAEANTPKADDRALHVKYRPLTFADVMGQDAVVASLKKALGSKNLPHAYLFSGPSGTGKTTLARIVAVMIGVPAANVMEIDAATNSGIDNMRNVTDVVKYKSLRGDSGLRFVIVDECHSLSKQTWQSLLKSIEEPPEHVFWAFCTTEPDKVPDTIRTRCLTYNLKLVSDDAIDDLLTAVNKKEKLGVDPAIIGVIARQAQGSPRRALVYLAQVQGATDKTSAMRLMETGVGEEEKAIDLARLLCQGKGSWRECQRMMAALDKDSPEGVRLIIVNYAAAMLKDAKNPEPLLAVLSAFQGTCNQSEKWAPIYLSIGQLLFNT